MLDQALKHLPTIKWGGFVLIPALLISFWLGVGNLIAQESGIPQAEVPAATASSVAPTVGTSLTAGGVFFLMISFVQKIMERNETEKKDIYTRHEKVIETMQRGWERVLDSKDKEREEIAGKYYQVVTELLNDTKSVRLGQIKVQPPRRRN